MHSGGTLLILHGRLGVTVKLKGADRGPTVRQCFLVAETDLNVCRLISWRSHAPPWVALAFSLQAVVIHSGKASRVGFLCPSALAYSCVASYLGNRAPPA